jgi:hypothetical protein
MCMEDIRIGRKSQSAHKNVGVTVNNLEIIGASPHRVALIFGNPASNNVFVSQDPQNLVLSGYMVNQTSGPLILRIEDWGQAITLPWFGVSSLGTNNLQITEVLLMDD